MSSGVSVIGRSCLDGSVYDALGPDAVPAEPSLPAGELCDSAESSMPADELCDPAAFPLPIAEEGGPGFALPMAGVVVERRDALRNRARVLAAAHRLVSETGVDGVDIREVARAACVGVGTVYRRFGDKAGLLAALLDERERLFQNQVLGGPPPLGPGAPARERLVAFLHALADLTEENLPLLRELHAQPGRRFHVGAYRAWRLHATVLLREAAPGIDAEWFAEMILATLAADLFYHQRYELGVGPERLRRNLEDAVDAIVGAEG